LSRGYDLFANVNRPLEEVRRELGIPPLESDEPVSRGPAPFARAS
jgi:hypothetical protein